MSGRRSSHLYRRGAVYWVRFRLPSDLSRALECTELRRSLGVKELAEAKKRCLAAALWFQTIVDALRHMPSPSVAELELAAAAFFQRLRSEQGIASFGKLTDDQFDKLLRTSDERILELDRQLVTNGFDTWVKRASREMCQAAGVDLASASSTDRVVARRLAARVERARLAEIVHDLTTPGIVYVPSDELFAAVPDRVLRSVPRPKSAGAISLKEAKAKYLEKLGERGVGTSHVTETARVLKWLGEVVGETVPLDAIATDDLRTFRDDVSALGRLRGKDIPFAERKAKSAGDRIKSVTAIRYWTAVRNFFQWAFDEGHIGTDPMVGLRIAKRKGEDRASPEIFSPEELRRLAHTPLYGGYRAPSRVNDPGEMRVRNGKWWSMILLLYTGMRAGEAAQLLPSDFAFDDEVPHIKVRETDDQGRKVKSLKTKASIRDVPIHSDLLILGLREFVEKRAKAYSDRRTFWDFRPGADGRKSDGMTKFWGAYLRKHGLWKPGRATHVGRHVVHHYLRKAGAAEEDISAVVGHAGRTVTSQYGGPYPLARKATTVERLDFGFDFVGALGGAFQKSRHAE